MAKSKGGGAERFWGSKKMYLAVTVLAVLVAIAAIGYSNSQATSGYATLGTGGKIATRTLYTPQEIEQFMSTAKELKPKGEMSTKTWTDEFGRNIVVKEQAFSYVSEGQEGGGNDNALDGYLKCRLMGGCAGPNGCHPIQSSCDPRYEYCTRCLCMDNEHHELCAIL